jgi:DsbC/DsbD-like thiol-disulfide interchange protein
MLRTVWILLATLFLIVPVRSDAAVPNHLSVDLISPYKALSPAHVSWIGLRFKLEPGWHIYWKDPGDSGEPPSVRWKLPDGVTAGTIRWPAPQRIPDHTLVDYGYERGVLLAVPVRLSRTVAVEAPLKLEATVNYLVCRDVCIPGTAHLDTSLPVSRRGSFQPSEWHTLFLQTRSRWPKAAPGTWKISALTTSNRFILTLHTGSSESAALFFPANPAVIKNAAPQTAAALPDGVRLTLEKSDLLVKPLPRLEGVVVLNGKGAFTVDARIHSETRGE